MWDWGWIWKSISIQDSHIGFKLLVEQGGGGGSDGFVGSASFMDSKFDNVATAIMMGVPEDKPGTGTTGVVLENVEFTNVNAGIVDTSGTTRLTGGSRHIASWVAGPSTRAKTAPFPQAKIPSRTIVSQPCLTYPKERRLRHTMNARSPSIRATCQVTLSISRISITIGAEYSLVSDGKGVLASDNEAVPVHPRWSQISLYDDKPSGKGQHISPEMATVIPMAHTTVAPKATFTVSEAAVMDIVQLHFDGNQNNAPGPGDDVCPACSFFRLITSTCCGIGGSIGNPVVFPADVAVPLDIPLPAGFTPPLPFKSTKGDNVPAGKPCLTSAKPIQQSSRKAAWLLVLASNYLWRLMPKNGASCLLFVLPFSI
ncbi:hypothetical protein VHEMI08429 [[Torrubiella] hemipterigena]|uniref:Uncharacterized protein n=1 Tax=[Torrubiella] hemipterigena TaxID=1531966 RepID=A0A0A1TDH2_9HYPO|nr:hypothetical protein VHEMI08429 [[Torrubiella] hemipterigena]